MKKRENCSWSPPSLFVWRPHSGGWTRQNFWIKITSQKYRDDRVLTAHVISLTTS